MLLWLTVMFLILERIHYLSFSLKKPPKLSLRKISVFLQTFLLAEETQLLKCFLAAEQELSLIKRSQKYGLNQKPTDPKISKEGSVQWQWQLLMLCHGIISVSAKVRYSVILVSIYSLFCFAGGWIKEPPYRFLLFPVSRFQSLLLSSRSVRRCAGHRLWICLVFSLVPAGGQAACVLVWRCLVPLVKAMEMVVAG